MLSLLHRSRARVPGQDHTSGTGPSRPVGSPPSADDLPDGTPRLPHLTAASPALRAELLERSRSSGMVIGWLTLLLMPSWTVVDRLLAPQQAAAFLVVRLLSDVPIALSIWALAGRPLGRRRPELPTFVVFGSVQLATAWMLPRVTHVDYYLLGSTLVLYASGCLFTARPRWTVGLVALTLAAVAAAVLTAPVPMSPRDLGGAAAYLVTASLVAVVAHLRRHTHSNRALLTRLRLERERERSRVLLARLERLSSEDPLTGLANRRQWDGELGRVCAEARDAEADVAVVLLDVDHFKLVNDRYGHAVGDEVLRRVAELLTAGVRGVDLVARLGGDELAVLLPGADVHRAVALAERIRDGVAHLAVPGLATGGTTVSLGVAAARGGQAFPVDLMSRADQQLYRAKITRNAVAAPSPVLPAPRAAPGTTGPVG